MSNSMKSLTDKALDLADEARILTRRAGRISAKLTASHLTPCQITGKPGIRMTDGARCIPMYLSPDMLDEFEKRTWDSQEFSEFEQAEDALHNFKVDNFGYEADVVGDFKLLDEWLNVNSSAESAEINYARYTLSVLKELKDEFGDTKVSS